MGSTRISSCRVGRTDGDQSLIRPSVCVLCNSSLLGFFILYAESRLPEKIKKLMTQCPPHHAGTSLKTQRLFLLNLFTRMSHIMYVIHDFRQNYAIIRNANESVAFIDFPKYDKWHWRLSDHPSNKLLDWRSTTCVIIRQRPAADARQQWRHWALWSRQPSLSLSTSDIGRLRTTTACIHINNSDVRLTNTDSAKSFRRHRWSREYWMHAVFSNL